MANNRAMYLQQTAHQTSIDDPRKFWLQQALELLDWQEKPTVATDAPGEGNEHKMQWFPDGKLNVCYNAIDRHVASGRGDQVAVIYDSPVTDTVKRFTYSELLKEVKGIASVLKRRGVQRGDTVLFYMAMVPQTLFAMLACARLGAIHSVVFGGFAPPELAKRIRDCRPKVILSNTCGLESKTKIIAYKPLLDQALELAEYRPEATIILQRDQLRVPLDAAKGEYYWDVELAEASAGAEGIGCEFVDSNHPLYMLYTSGTTGMPKGVVRPSGPHALSLLYMQRNMYGLKPGETMFTYSDFGWALGHSYSAYGPLLNGSTTVLFEGKPVGTPDAGQLFRAFSQHDVRVFLCAPTVVVILRRTDPDGLFRAKYDLTHMRALFLAGERCTPEVQRWWISLITGRKPSYDADTIECGDEICNVVSDHWWQTESGAPLTGISIGFGSSGKDVAPIKYGSAGMPLPGANLQVIRVANDVDEEEAVDRNPEFAARDEVGNIVLKLPLPPGFIVSLWNDDERFYTSYFKRYPGYYDTGDSGMIDSDGYVHILSRTDDIIKVAAHRLSTSSIEEVVFEHSGIAECCVVAKPDPIKGSVPMVFAVVKSGIDQSSMLAIQNELVKRVRTRVGPIVSLYAENVVQFELLDSHLLIQGKSQESDQLLEFVKGMCDAVTKRFAKTLVIGISVHPARPSYIRELYAFQFSFGTQFTNAKAIQQGGSSGPTTRLLLRRVVSLLKEMEASVLMTLKPAVPADYTPPGFTSLTTNDIESYTILPQCGSTRVGKTDSGDSAMYMCALCVEGPADGATPLGSRSCPTPMPLDVDDDPHERVLVASPGWISSLQKSIVTRKKLNAIVSCTPIPGARDGIAKDTSTTDAASTTLWCECNIRLDSDASTGIKALHIRKLAILRRAVSLLKHHPNGSLTLLIKNLGCSDARGRAAIDHLRSLDLVSVDCSTRPYSFSAVTSAWQSAAQTLFSDDINAMQAFVGSPGDKSSGPGAQWTPSAREQKVYGYLFSLVDTDRKGVIQGQAAVPFFQKSGLADTELGRIWQLADKKSKGHLTQPEFGVAMKLISLAQANRPALLSNLGSETKLPELRGVDLPLAIEADDSRSHTRRGSSTSSVGWPSFASGAAEATVPANEREQYKRLFENSHPVDGAIDGMAARAFLMKSKLSTEQLGRIWNLADPHAEGRLHLPGFVVAMYYVRRIMENRNLELPSTCPPSLWKSAGGDIPAPSLLQTAVGNFSDIYGQNASTPDLSSVQWDISAEEKERYDQFFNNLDKSRRGYLSGDTPVNFFLKSRLSESVLAKVWDLADTSRTGKLNKEQFAVAMHLINARLAGREIPDTLPATLVPPSMRKASIASSSLRSLSPSLRPVSARDRTHQLEPLRRAGTLAYTHGSAPSSAIRPSTSRSPPPKSPTSDDSEIAALQGQLSQLEDMSRGLQTQRTTVAGQIAVSSARKQELEVKISALQSSQEAEAKINYELEEKLKTEQAKVTALQAQVDEAGKKLAIVGAQKSQLERDVQHVQSQQNELQQRLRQAQEEGQRLTAEISALDRQKKHLEQVLS
ncbi:hypothetical protein GGI12_002260, partial [Dipsacomyces acuminosporus]